MLQLEPSFAATVNFICTSARRLMSDIRFIRDLRELETLPEHLVGRFEFWRGAAFGWKQWDRPHENWTHDHCDACFACICDHRERFPYFTQDHEERGCYRHAYYAKHENGGYLWVCRTCFKRLKDQFDWTVSAEL